MKDHFFELTTRICRAARAGETLMFGLAAERSDFVRFNHARVRQAGSVEQRHLTLRLIRDGRQAAAHLALAGTADDTPACSAAIAALRDVIAQLPPDPLLLYNETPQSTSVTRRSRLPDAQSVVAKVAALAGAVDFVGFYAAGTLFRGYANSLGQQNWHEVDTFNFDWSLHLGGDKAVKDGYSGYDWEPAEFESRLEAGAQRLELVAHPARTLAPGACRVYLEPRALEEITSLLQGDAFSARARQTRQSALLRMAHGARLSPQVSMTENTEDGVAPGFQDDGYIRPATVPLIEAGELAGPLVSPRSAREYGLAPNGADARESPESLDMAPGTLEAGDVLAALDNGLYVSNLWYLNYSDKPAARMTGMTRFATFLVERGRIVCPVTPLRFDDALYSMLGSNLEGLTRSRERLLSTSTYGGRSTASAHLPGALLSALRFTL